MAMDDQVCRELCLHAVIPYGGLGRLFRVRIVGAQHLSDIYSYIASLMQEGPSTSEKKKVPESGCGTL
jgi:hypothetical protein